MMPRGFAAAQLAYDNMSPPCDDMPMADCETCRDEFEFDPSEYTDADEDGMYMAPPTVCPTCESKEES